MRIFFLVLTFSMSLSWSQTPEVKTDSLENTYLIIVGDTLINKAIGLDEILILPKLKLNSYNERRQYLILQRKTLKVYPYAKLAAERLEVMKERMANVKSKRKRKQYAKRVQNYIEDEFSEKLKKFTITEGQILIKLIHRQTGETAFNLIKQLRSGWRAFWYNNTAKLFDMSLKIPFDPETVKEDFLIEDILQRQFQNGALEFQQAYKPFDLYELSKKWHSKSIN